MCDLVSYINTVVVIRSTLHCVNLKLVCFLEQKLKYKCWGQIFHLVF